MATAEIPFEEVYERSSELDQSKGLEPHRRRRARDAHPHSRDRHPHPGSPGAQPGWGPTIDLDPVTGSESALAIPPRRRFEASEMPTEVAVGS